MRKKDFDFLIVGAGLYGAMFAYRARQRGMRVLVIDKNPHVGGGCYTEEVDGIQVHRYGPHIFHTSNKEVWDFVNSLVPFNNFVNMPIACFRGKRYNLPFNMNTFYQLWGVETADEARAIIEQQRAEFAHIAEPANLEEQALKLAGRDIYETLIKGYSEKQWGMKATEIPAFVIRRLPFRFEYNNNYFNDTYQGIPIGGYTRLFEKLLDGCEVRLKTDYFEARAFFDSLADTMVYTGRMDSFYDCRFGELDFRSLHFEHKQLEGIRDFQGNAVVNYTEAEVPYTRCIEHKHFEFGQQPNTVVTYEYPQRWETGAAPYYPINNERNNRLYARYAELAAHEDHVLFGGRLAEYKYYDMHQIVEKVLALPLTLYL
ncbi:MAG: UDP-galactopyranose mutase [Bacteroidaceae bacterium]|nr:UDP-galactopyranose mutase [Bacteroidaceae bacterium]